MSDSTILYTALAVMALTWTLWWIRWSRLRLAESPQQRMAHVHSLPVGLVVLALFGLLPGAPLAASTATTYPRVLMVFTPLTCNGEPRLQSWVDTSTQWGGPHKVTCTHANGMYQDISLRTVVVASAGFAAMILTLVVWLRSAWLLRRLLRRRRGGGN